jgi:hypothetical protein
LRFNGNGPEGRLKRTAEQVKYGMVEAARPQGNYHASQQASLEERAQGQPQVQVLAEV